LEFCSNITGLGKRNKPVIALLQKSYRKRSHEERSETILVPADGGPVGADGADVACNNDWLLGLGASSSPAIGSLVLLLQRTAAAMHSN
jgi:hypothetical protein